MLQLKLVLQEDEQICHEKINILGESYVPADCEVIQSRH